MTNEQKYVTYEQFGAVGDGVADDMPAIVACHKFANEKKLPVRANDNATYYIGGKDLTAVIRTDVNWGNAHFIIDDREIENIKQVCFSVVGDGERFAPEIKSLNCGQKKVDFPHEGSVFVSVSDESRRVYIRKGLNMDNGRAASDCFVVDAYGNVTGDINWDYDSITGAYAVSADDEPIVIEGGIFTTIANRQPSFYNYHLRNIRISRSHVTVRGLTHYITGEGETGAPYNGFLCPEFCYDVTLRDCLLTPHLTYRTESKVPGEMVSMGSYDLSIGAVVGVKLINIRQTIDITDRRYWGLMGSNFSKNFYMEGCEMSRYDAHMGVTNCRIKNCRLGHMGTNLIGFGECIIENTTFISSRAVSLRHDYGATFRGRLVMKNCTWIPTDRNGKASAEIINAKNEGDHDFGYECAMPYEIVIDGLTIDDRDVVSENLVYYVLPDYDPDFSANKPYPYVTPLSVFLRRISSVTGREIRVLCHPEQYPGLENVKIGEK